MPLYFFALIFFIFTTPAYAIDQMYNWNGLEFVTSGNVTHVHPASPESTRLRGGWVLDISDVEPKATASHDLPYKHKGGALAKVQVRPSIDPSKVAAKAKDAIKAGAAGLATGSGYVAVASIACTLLCDAAIDALKDWGLDNLSFDGSEVYARVADDSASESDGYYWSSGCDIHLNHVVANYKALICNHGGPSIDPAKQYSAQYTSDPCYFSMQNSRPTYVCTAARYNYGKYVTKFNVISYRQTSKHNCPVGSYVTIDDACISEQPTKPQLLSDYFLGNYSGKGWSHHWAKMTAAIVAAGGNVFTDGTSVDITGPSIVPLSTSETRTSVNLIPGTNTPAPIGHTGPTDPGTQTTTTTTTAKNTYTPAPFTSSSGPSMTTTQQTQTVTNIINNITNITTTENTTITESDDSPEKEQKEFCEQNPDSLACAELDTPEAEIPRDTVNITFAPENLGFGAGTCPADKQIGPHTFSYAATCDILASYVKPLVIALALFGALLIVFVGKSDA